jgi:parallel beta-helix repeat protein
MPAARATNYYVDPSSTSTITNGSLLNPWKTISQMNAGTTMLNPGDSVLFRRGQSFSGRLLIQRSGITGKPIVYSSYGEGGFPELNNSISDIISISNKQYIIIDGLKITDRSISVTDHSVQAKVSYAITITNSPYCTISNCDISLVGVGIALYAGSDFTTIKGNYMHNLRMVRNTPTSINPDDDYGANPMVIGSSGNKILNNRFEDCWANSYDYGFDGGAVEFFGTTMNNNEVMYNTAINCNGFLEIGSSTGGIAENNLVAYNKIINCGIIGVYQNGSTFTVTIKNLQYYNNVVIETMKQFTKPSVLFWMAGTGNPGLVVLKNNIFWLSSGVNVASSKFNSGQMIHNNNIYRMSSGIMGISLHSSELLDGMLQLFTSTNGEPFSWALEPIANAKSINFGVPVGLNTDFIGKNIEGNPDAGIFESISSITERPAPLVIAASSGQINCFGETTSVTISASGGAQPYMGIGTFKVSSGTHQFMVSDAMGNKDSITIAISQPAQLTSTLTSGSITTAGGTTTITVSANGGTTPYTYGINGSPFQTSSVFNGIYAGDYTVTTKDYKGCVSIKNLIIAESTENYYNPRYRVSIWPNPTTNYWKLQLSKIHGPYVVYLTVYSAAGQLMYSTKGDVYSIYSFGQSFVPGSYYVKVKVGTGSKSYTILKL